MSKALNAFLWFYVVECILSNFFSCFGLLLCFLEFVSNSSYFFFLLLLTFPLIEPCHIIDIFDHDVMLFFTTLFWLFTLVKLEILNPVSSVRVIVLFTVVFKTLFSSS